MKMVTRVIGLIAGFVFATSVFAQGVIVTPSAGGPPSMSSPVYAYCDSTSQGTITSTAGVTISCPTTTQNLNLYASISGQCYPCSAPMSNGQLSSPSNSVVGNGCAVVGDATNLNLSPISTTFNANPVVSASFCAGGPPPSGSLTAPTNLAATGSGQSITVTWAAATGGTPPISYTATATPNQPDSGSPIVESGISALSANLSGLQLGVTYSITVEVIDSAKPTSNIATSTAIIYSPSQPPANNIPSPSPAQMNLFNTFGVGANINSHYDHDSWNSIYYAFLQNDVNQLGASGLKTIRAYSLSQEIYVSLINAINNYNQQNPSNKVNLVYQFSLCKSDAYNQQADGSNTCIDIAKGDGGWTSVNQIVTAETTKLNGVINAVGASTFASVVPLIIVSNEDLIISHGFDYSGSKPVAYTSGQDGYQATGKYNDADITNALSTVQSILSANNALKNIPLSADLVVFNPKYADNPTKTAFRNVVTNNYHTGPVLMNIYPYQFGAGNSDGSNAVCPNGGKDNPSCITQVNALYSLVAALLTTTDQQILNALQQKGFMLGETGWPNAGTPSPGEYMTTVTGSVKGTQNYLNDVIAFANNYSIPVVLFEAYDEPKKAAASDPESHYGIFSWNNDPWITVNQNGININAANKGPANNPYYFDPTQYTLLYPTNGVTGSVTVIAKKDGSKTVYSFNGPSVTGFKRADGDTVQIKVTSAPCTASTAMYCDATFSMATTKFSSSGSCADSSLSGINWNSDSASKAIKSSINLAVPTASMCTGVKPIPGGIPFTLFPGGTGSIQIGTGPVTQFAGPAPTPAQMTDGATVTLTSNCSGGGSLVCTGTYSKTTGQISNIAETSPNTASASSGGGDCGDQYTGGISWSTQPMNELHFGAPNQNACAAN